MCCSVLQCVAIIYAYISIFSDTNTYILYVIEYMQVCQYMQKYLNRSSRTMLCMHTYFENIDTYIHILSVIECMHVCQYRLE